MTDFNQVCYRKGIGMKKQYPCSLLAKKAYLQI